MMRLPKMEYISPASVEEACVLLDKHGPEARILGGGTDLLVAAKLRNVRPSLLVSLGSIEALKGIRSGDGGDLTIGAMTSLHDIKEDLYVAKSYPALAQAAAAVGANQLQHMGSIGGNLCLNTRCTYYNQSDTWRKTRAVCFKMGGEICHVVPRGKKCYAVFSADTAPALIALDARVKLVGPKAESMVDLKDLYTGEGMQPVKIGRGELISEIRVPAPSPKQSSTYLKYRIRESVDFPLAGVAVRMDAEGGKCRECRIVLNAMGSAPVSVAEAEALLKDRPLSGELIEQAVELAVKAAHPVDNLSGAGPAYRRHMAGVLTRRALGKVAGDLGLIQHLRED